MTNPSPGGNPDPYQPGGAQNPYQQGGSADPHQSQPTGGETGQPYEAPTSGYPQPGYPGGEYQAQGYQAQGYPPTGYPQPGYPPAGYPQPGYPGYQASGTNVMAILSLVFAFVFSPAGIVLGHLAKKQIRETGQQGDQLATWGLVLSYIFTGISVLFCCGAFGLGMIGAATENATY